MNGKLPIAATVVALVLALGLFTAHAASTVSCEVMTISASNSGKGIDPALRAYAPVFRQAPFSLFNSFELVNRQTIKLEFSIPNKLTLPSPLEGFLRLNAMNNGKLNLTLTLVRNDHKPITINGMASPGTPFFAAGLSHLQGVWIFGVVCNNDGIISH